MKVTDKWILKQFKRRLNHNNKNKGINNNNIVNLCIYVPSFPLSKICILLLLFCLVASSLQLVLNLPLTVTL